MTYQPRDPFLPTSEIPPPRPKSTKPVWIVLGVIVAICLVFCAVGAIATSGEPEGKAKKTAVAEAPPPGVPDPGVRPSVTPPKPKPVKEKPKPINVGDGTYVVGDEIPAGIYKAKGAEDSAFVYCIWSVKSGEDIDDRYLDSGSASKTKAPQRVKLKMGQVFETSGCSNWTRQ